MDSAIFRKKYMGEVTLKNGEHIKFLFPVNDETIDRARIAATNIWQKMRDQKDIVRSFQWAIIDDLDFSQFLFVFAATGIYGENYWKFVWEHYLETQKKK